MLTRIIENQRNGRYEVIENPLLVGHIQVGLLIWYHGFTSQGPWSCPAIIRRVDLIRSRFYVRSLDDLLPQTQPYGFDPEVDHSYSRQTMRLPTLDEVADYLAEFDRRLEDIPEYIPE